MIQLQDYKAENTQLKSDNNSKRESIEATEKEFRRLQDKH